MTTTWRFDDAEEAYQKLKAFGGPCFVHVVGMPLTVKLTFFQIENLIDDFLDLGLMDVYRIELTAHRGSMTVGFSPHYVATP